MAVENMWKKRAFSNENYFCQFRWFDLVVCVGTPTWLHIPFLHSVSRFSSQPAFLFLYTHPDTNPDNGRLSVTVKLSSSLYLCLTDKTAL